MHLATRNSKHCYRDLEEMGFDFSHTARNVEAAVKVRHSNPGMLSRTQSLSVLLLVTLFLTCRASMPVG